MRGFLGTETGEIIPVPIVFGSVGLAEIPAVAAVRRLGRRPVADFAAALAVAQPDLGRGPAFAAVRPPARETPIVRSLLPSHMFRGFRGLPTAWRAAES